MSWDCTPVCKNTRTRRSGELGCPPANHCRWSSTAVVLLYHLILNSLFLAVSSEKFKIQRSSRTQRGLGVCFCGIFLLCHLGSDVYHTGHVLGPISHCKKKKKLSLLFVLLRELISVNTIKTPDRNAEMASSSIIIKDTIDLARPHPWREVISIYFSSAGYLIGDKTPTAVSAWKTPHRQSWPYL